MRNYLDILVDALRIATFQPPVSERYPRPPRQPSRSRTIGMTWVP